MKKYGTIILEILNNIPILTSVFSLNCGSDDICFNIAKFIKQRAIIHSKSIMLLGKKEKITGNKNK